MPTCPVPVPPPLAPSPGRAFGPRVTVVARPLPGPKQVHPLGAHHHRPPWGRENRGLEMCDFPTAQPGLGALPHGLCTQADHRDPGQETPDALWARDGAPCPAPSWLHRAGRGTPEQLCKTRPLKHTKPPPQRAGAGSSTHSPLQRPWASPGPRSCPPSTRPTPCREGAGPRGCPAPSQALRDGGSGGVHWGRQSLRSHVRGAPMALPARAPASSWRRIDAQGSRTSGPNTPLDPAQGQLGAGSSGLRAATPPSPAPGLLWPHGLQSRPKLLFGRDHREGPLGRTHWVPMATPPTRHRLRPHLPAPLPSR